MNNQRNRRALSCAFEFALFCIISTILSLAFIIPTLSLVMPKQERATALDTSITVIIDAGHGGEDGGCEGNGLVEKELNLDISLRLAALLRKEGVNVIMTREDDELLYDKSSDYKGKKKAQDVRNRLKIAQSYEDPVFISIHMNYYPQTQYSGLQVWYSKNDPRSRILAALVQSEVKASLQPNNKRSIKEAGSSIFLLHNATFPAILIECGFLSNPQDARALSDEEYRQKLADAIFRSIMEYISHNST